MSGGPTGRAPNGRPRREPLQEYFSIGDVCALTGLKAHVLRYWETQFRVLSPAKNRSGNRVYARREVELVLLVKHLLYTEKYTVDGARQKLDEQRRAGALRGAARDAMRRDTIGAIERELGAIVDVLEGRRPPRGPADAAFEAPADSPADASADAAAGAPAPDAAADAARTVDGERAA